MRKNETETTTKIDTAPANVVPANRIIDHQNNDETAAAASPIAKKTAWNRLLPAVGIGAPPRNEVVVVEVAVAPAVADEMVIRNEATTRKIARRKETKQLLSRPLPLPVPPLLPLRVAAAKTETRAVVGEIVIVILTEARSDLVRPAEHPRWKIEEKRGAEVHRVRTWN